MSTSIAQATSIPLGYIPLKSKEYKNSPFEEEYRIALDVEDTTFTDPYVSEYYDLDENNTKVDPSVREVFLMCKKVMLGFFSFSAIGLIAFTCFVLLGIIGTISVPVSVFGLLLSGGLVIGVYLDYRKWERKYV